MLLAPLGTLVDLAAQNFLVPANKLEYLLSLACQWGVAVGPNQVPARFVASLTGLTTLVEGGRTRDPGAHPGEGPRHRVAPQCAFALAAGSTPVGGRIGPALARPLGGDSLLAVESVQCRPSHPPPPGPDTHR